MPEDTGFLGMWNTKYTAGVVVGGALRGGGFVPQLQHSVYGWAQNAGELSGEAADQAINAESTKTPGCQWELEPVSPAWGVCLHGSLSLLRSDLLRSFDQVSTLWGHCSWAHQPSVVLSGPRLWSPEAEKGIKICVNDLFPVASPSVSFTSWSQWIHLKLSYKHSYINISCGFL